MRETLRPKVQGTGKSSFAVKIAAAFMRSRYGTFSSSDVVTLNETDDYQSEFRSSHKVVIFDDLAAEIVNRQPSNPWRKVIDFVNNIRKTSLNPNVEMKGNVYIEPDLVIITTNMNPEYMYHIQTWMTCPSAILRRIKEHVFVKNFGECQIIEDQTREAPDFTHRGLPGNSTSLTHLHSFRIRAETEIGGVQRLASMETLSRDDYIKQATLRFEEHMLDQEQFVELVNSDFDDIETKSPLKCFYDDMIKPILPQKVFLPPAMERYLPWWNRIARFFCQPNNKIAICHTIQPRIETIDVAIQPVTNPEINIDVDGELKSTYEILPFLQREPRSDPFMEELITTQPKEFTFCLREWENSAGVGDLVYLVDLGRAKYYIVVEIKTSDISKAFKQAHKYARTLVTYTSMYKLKKVSVLELAVTPDSFLLGSYSEGVEIPQIIRSIIQSWMDRFQDRCGAVVLANMKNHVSE